MSRAFALDRALSDEELEGPEPFTNLACRLCHESELLDGSMYEKVGAAQP